jgi:predicted Zn-dependent peptidase
MIARSIPVLVVIGALVGVQPAAAQYPTSPPPATPLRALEFPEFRLSTLANGLEVLVVENHELPVVSISLAMPAGSKYEPEGLEGLAGVVSELMTKGTTTRSAEEIAETIEGVGSNLLAAPGQDFFTVSTTVLTEYAPLGFELIGDVLLHSTFPEDELELARTRFLSSLQAEKTDPGAVAGRYFAKALYGDHPYGRSHTDESYNSITRDRILEFVESRMKPEGSLLVVAGDISESQVRELATDALGAWQGEAAEMSFPSPPAAQPTHTILVHRPGSEQSNILVGNLAMRPGDPQYYAAVLANRVLGGGSDARLFKILREDKAWTYGAYSRMTRPQDIGYFQANAEVRNEVTDSALTELMHQLQLARSAAPPDSEMVAAIGYLVGSFPRQIETPRQVASQVSNTRLLGLGDDYLQKYRERLSAVTAGQASEAASYLIRPDSAVIVVVGDGKEVYDKLTSVAPVTIIDVDGNALTVGDLNPAVTAIAFDPSHIVARRDSFQVVVQGQVFGSRVLTVEEVGDTLVVSDVMAIPMAGMQQEGVIRMNPTTFAVYSVEQTGQMQGQPSNIHMTYDGLHVTGTATTPSPTGTATEVTVDTMLAEGTVDGEALEILYPALPLAEGASFTFNVFDPSEGVVKTTTVKVAGVQEITVPAGTFSAFKLEIQTGDVGLVAYVSQDAPRKTLRLEIVGQPIAFELVN